MPRKKSVGGRSRGITIESRLIRSIEKTNKALNRIERSGKYGKYASKKLLKLTNDKTVRYKRKNKFKFKIKNVRTLTTQQQLKYLKVFTRFLKSPTSSESGLIKAETEVKERVRKSLGEVAEKELTDEDVEDFYDFMTDENLTSYFLQYMKPSDLYGLILEAKEQGWNEDKFIQELEQFMTINIEETRNKAKRLYEKYVR